MTGKTLIFEREAPFLQRNGVRPLVDAVLAT
jgi:hypothetical protein